MVLDFGVWARDERTALRALADGSAPDASWSISINDAAQQERVAERRLRVPGLHVPDLRRRPRKHGGRLFQPPDAVELGGTEPLDPPPPGFDSWSDWAARRWPSLQ